MNGITVFSDDDLPGFLSSPPGTPPAAEGARAGPEAAPAEAARVAERTVGVHHGRRTRILATSAAVVLLVCGVVTAVALGTRGPTGADPSTAASAAPSSSPSSPPSAPALPAQPANPSPGDPGAAALAATDLPVGPGDLSARLAAAGVVLAPAPAGVTAGFPRVSLTTSGKQALLHLALPTANCLTPTAPTRLEDGGCQPAATEFADLGTPALRMTPDGNRLTFSGHLPTYSWPVGAPPVWTGRAYDVTVTVDLPEPAGNAPLPAAGTVTVGDQKAPTLPGAAMTSVVYGR